jgi:hypothetical protein
MILHNKAAPGYKDPGLDEAKKDVPQEQEGCQFKQMARVLYKDEKCQEIDFKLTKEMDQKYYPISYATEACGCNAATGKCHTSTCTENAVTFSAYDFEDKQCRGQGQDFWKAWFNRCVGRMIVHNRAAPGFKDPGYGLVPGGSSPKFQRIQRIWEGLGSAFDAVSQKAMDKFSELYGEDDFLN